MAALLARRLLVLIPVLFGVTVLVFSALYAIPGDPARVLLFGTSATPQAIARLRAELGLNQPFYAQYWHYLENLLHGNLGYSYATRQPVATEIGIQLQYTIQLAATALVVALAVGIPLGIISGLRPNGWIDKLATGVAVLGVAVPYFWLAILLVLLFAVKLHVLPAVGTGPPDSIILPAISLGWGFASIIARLLRNSLIEVYQTPFILVARAKGLSGWYVLTRHALRNAAASTLTVLGLQLGYLLAGAVAIEVIFGRPGIGSLLVTSIGQKDVPTVQGTVLLVAVTYLVANLLVDVFQGVLDPRIRTGGAR